MEEAEWRIPPFKGRVGLPRWAKEVGNDFEFFSKCGKGYNNDTNRKRHEPHCHNCREA